MPKSLKSVIFLKLLIISVLGYRHIKVAPVPASACCGARVLWRFDQFNGRVAINWALPRILVFFTLLCINSIRCK